MRNNYTNIGVFSFVGFASNKRLSTQNFEILEYSVNELVNFILSPIVIIYNQIFFLRLHD
jgi:hypothetical protein